MITDVVCGNELKGKKALHKKYGDRPYFFCCTICRERFLRDPFRYLDRSPLQMDHDRMPQSFNRKR